MVILFVHVFLLTLIRRTQVLLLLLSTKLFVVYSCFSSDSDCSLWLMLIMIKFILWCLIVDLNASIIELDLYALCVPCNFENKKKYNLYSILIYKTTIWSLNIRTFLLQERLFILIKKIAFYHIYGCMF